MPAYLTHFRILHQTLGWLESVATDPSAPQTLKDLASRATVLLQTGDVPTTSQKCAISKTAHFGSVGPDFVSAAAFFAKGKEYEGGPEGKWAGEKALHDDDSPDFLANTTNIILKFIEKIPPSSRDALMSYALGYMIHVAGDVIVHPYVNAFKNDDSSHSLIEVNQDSWASQQYFGRDDVHSGDSWSEYLFEEDDNVVDSILDVFNSAFVDTFFPGMSGSDLRPPGVSEDLAMSKNFLLDGYSTTRDVVLDIVYDWSPWEFYWLPSLIFMAITVGAVLLFWLVLKKFDFGDPIVMAAFDASNISSWVGGIILTSIITGIFHHGVTEEIVYPLVIAGVATLFMATMFPLALYNSEVKNFMSELSVRELLFGISFLALLIPFSVELTRVLDDQAFNLVGFIWSASSLGFLVVAGTTLGLTLPIHYAIDESREEIHWADLVISAVWGWIWGFLGHVIGAISMYPPTEPDDKFSGPLGAYPLKLRGGEQQAEYADLPTMIDKAKVFAGILCMGSVLYQQEPSAQTRLKLDLFKNWNLNGPGDLWQKIMGDYDANTKDWVDSVDPSGTTAYRWLRNDAMEQYDMIEYLLGYRAAYP